MSDTTRFRMLYAGPVLAIGEIRWRGSATGYSREFSEPMAEITFQRRGMFVKNHGPRRDACDPNTLLFIDADEPYRLSHPAELDCACTALYLSRDAVRDLVRRAGGSATAVDTGSFGFADGPGRRDFTLRHYALLARARQFHETETASPADSRHAPDRAAALELEERGLRLAAAAVDASLRFHTRRRRAIRPETRRFRRDTAEAVKSLLASHLQEGVSLAELAARVHVAPSHLCRLFKQETGRSMHQYLGRLRLLQSVEHLLEPGENLMALAMRMGFSHHSHFTREFSREFGIPPSRVRRFGTLRPAAAAGRRGTLFSETGLAGS